MPPSPPARLQPGDQVTLHYRLSHAGQVLASTFDEAPETFTLGSGELDPRLEILLLGLAPGARQRWTLEPWQAFGEHDASLIQTFPRADFPDHTNDLSDGLRVDFELPNGETLHGTILSIDEDSVQIDFNHPLAGLAVEFEVEVRSIAKGRQDAQ